MQTMNGDSVRRASRRAAPRQSFRDPRRSPAGSVRAGICGENPTGKPAPGKDDPMITHFAEYELTTVSIEGVKQVYADRLGFAIEERTDDCIRFRISALTTLSFREVFAPLKPAHFAFTVPWSKFEE